MLNTENKNRIKKVYIDAMYSYTAELAISAGANYCVVSLKCAQEYLQS